ncbi:MAG TPA: c-type cytochrome [Candidatus Krumholzibacteria bacterium]|nr:c-type cytochrome [Candidatus Krumholzibacteria bacterium]HRX51437.1 c-type cytochrome [Candidatus Krumholzibacteria bacterium]
MPMSLRALILALLLAGAATAALPESFTNLTVLPSDTPKDELMDVMKSFSTALGVRCIHCHVQKTPGDYDSVDWASDELEPKKVARGMMKLVQSVNGDLLPDAGVKGHTVSCVTCHRGLTDPATLDEVLGKTIAAEGVDAAVAEYRDLRNLYYGSGSYDFGPGVLAGLARERTELHQDVAGAEALLNLNVETHGDDPDAWILRAQFLDRADRRAEALADVRKALELAPGHRRAVDMLERLGG